jgi:sialic acid synthase SpsE
VHDLAAGTVLAAGDLITKRPGSGIPANQLATVIGRTLAKAVAADTLLQMNDLVDDPA